MSKPAFRLPEPTEMPLSAAEIRHGVRQGFFSSPREHAPASNDPDGAYLFNKIKARCTEEGDCLLWPGNTTADGARPKVWLAGKSVPLRRALWEEMHGNLKRGERVGVDCKTLLCVARSHLVITTRSQELKGIRRDASFGAKIAATKRAKSRFTPEIVEAVRSSSLNNVALGKELGMNHQTIARMRRHEIWKTYSTPFAGLGAR